MILKPICGTFLFVCHYNIDKALYVKDVAEQLKSLPPTPNLDNMSMLACHSGIT